MNLLPEFLKQGDTVAIVSPSGIVEEKPVLDAVSILNSWGLTVKMGDHVFARHGIFAGTDVQRTTDFNAAIDDPAVKAIICSRGGYGAMRIIQDIHLEKLKHHPRWVVGFSDITVFHAALTKLGICSIHGVMPNSFHKTHADSLSSLHSALFGKPGALSFPSHPLNHGKEVSGKLVGGNLSLLYALRGTAIDMQLDDSILFIEDVGEKIYHLDRMLTNFELGGIFGKIKGIVVGAFSEMTEGSTPYGLDAYGLISAFASKHKLPVAFGLDAGHINRNLSLIIGHRVRLTIGEDLTEIAYQ